MRPIAATLLRELRHGFDQQAAPTTPRLEVQRVALRHAVVGSCLDERAAIEVQMPFELDVKLVQRETVADSAQEDGAPEIAVVGTGTPEFVHFEPQLLRGFLHPAVLLALGIVEDDVAAELHLCHGMLEAGWSCATI